MTMVIFIIINFKISHWIPTLQQVTVLVTRISNIWPSGRPRQSSRQSVGFVILTQMYPCLTSAKQRLHTDTILPTSEPEENRGVAGRPSHRCSPTRRKPAG